jgi:hypothetical protein
MILHWFLLACVPIEENQQKTILNGQWNHYPVMFIQCLYTIEFLCKICAYGLVLPPHTQLRHIFGAHEIKPEKRNHKACLNSFGNILDVISLLSYWADVVLMTYRYPNLSLFKSLGASRPIRLLSIFPGTAVNINLVLYK